MTPELLARAVAALERSERLSGEAIAAWQRQALVVLARHHAAQSPAFAARLAEAGLTPDDLGREGALSHLPVLDRRAVQTAGPGFFARAVPAAHGDVHENRTSGSTGEPVMVRRTQRNRLDWMAMTMRDHRWQRRDFRWRFCAVRALLPQIATRPDWGAPVALLHPSGPSMGVPNGLPIERQAEAIAGFAPETLMAYPSNLDGLLDWWAERGAPPLRDLRTMGETLPPALRERVAGQLGIALSESYSSEELGYVALQCEAGRLHVMAETLLVELLDAAGDPVREGEVGRVVATDLSNFATPLIRYDVGDHAEAGGACACGRGLPTLGRVLGRTRNLATAPDGGRFWPKTGFKRYRDVAPVRQYQFVQHGPDRIEARLWVERPLNAGEEEALRVVMRDALGYPFAIDFSYSDGRIEAGPTGKFDEFINRIPMP